MPFYDLYCAQCNKEFNIMASMSDKTERNIPCPDCGSMDLSNVYKSAPAYIKSRVAQCPNATSACGGCRHAG